MTLTETTTWTIIIFAMVIVGCLLGMLLINHIAGSKRDVHLGHFGFCAMVSVIGLISIIVLWTYRTMNEERECRIAVTSELTFDEETVTAVTRDDILSEICG